MAKNQLSFFAAKADLESLLRAVESKRQLQFVVTGLFDMPTVEPVESLLAAPTLGQADAGDTNRVKGYLVADRAISFKVRTVPQRRGATKFAVDQLANPASIAFRPGGSFSENCLIAGQVGTVSDNLDSVRLFQLFSKELRHQFTKVKSFHVGKQAGKLLDDGWRLTVNVKLSVLCDLMRD